MDPQVPNVSTAMGPFESRSSLRSYSVLMDLTSENIGSPYGNESLKSFSQGQINYRSGTDGDPHIKIGRFGRYFSYKLKQLNVS